ncbi:MAG: type I-E CRISPR-associated protein Cse2/CasB [Alcanivorax sp.]|nr:type I-E CRISPR-associated protein Cse2/CasB [Alcanivorax sp.]
MSNTTFSYPLRDKAAREGVLRWWSNLEHQRGARAELRRCHTVDAVLLTEGFRNLWQALEHSEGRRDTDMLAWACVAAALAAVRQEPADKNRTLAECLGAQKEKTGKPCVSELRFAQLQKSRDQDAFLRRLRRALALIGKTAPVLSLAESVLLWFREQKGDRAWKPQDRLAVRWATDYFTTVSAYDR